jgi:hypothetical protein
VILLLGILPVDSDLNKTYDIHQDGWVYRSEKRNISSRDAKIPTGNDPLLTFMLQ